MSFSLSEIFSSVVVQLCVKEHSLIRIDMRQLLHLGLSRWEKQKLRLNHSLSHQTISPQTRDSCWARLNTDTPILSSLAIFHPTMITVFERASAILRTIYGKRKWWTVLLRGNPIRLIPTLFDHPVIPPNLILKTRKQGQLHGFTFIFYICVGTVFLGGLFSVAIWAKKLQKNEGAKWWPHTSPNNKWVELRLFIRKKSTVLSYFLPHTTER